MMSIKLIGLMCLTEILIGFWALSVLRTLLE